MIGIQKQSNPNHLGAYLLALWMTWTLNPIHSANAGDMLTPEDLTRKSDAIAFVTFDLKQGRIKVEQWLMLNQQDGGAEKHQTLLTQSSAELSRLCLPNRSMLKHWIKRYPKRSVAVSLWRKALKTGQYKSYLYLRKGPGKRFKAYCETETLNATHWEEHPQFKDWSNRLKAAIMLKLKGSTETSPMKVAPSTSESL